MDYFRVVLLGISVWLIVSNFLFLSNAGGIVETLGSYFLVVHYIFLIFTLLFISYFYYRSSTGNGFALGGIFLGIYLLLEVILTIPIYLEGGYLDYVKDWKFLVPFVFVFIIPMIYGLIISRKNKVPKDKKVPVKEVKDLKKGKINVQKSPTMLKSINLNAGSKNRIDSKSVVKIVAKK